ncbi:uncharacterized protein PgNI_06861, partial [Pyricularia grisea]|uniref:Uncharacterized protein n=1 Tax=Pyricularia grisea TaxID=148305 RepID=A0A6P8B125_PYRGI
VVVQFNNQGQLAQLRCNLSSTAIVASARAQFSGRLNVTVTHWAVQDSAAIHSRLGGTAYCVCLRPASNSLVANPRLSVYYGSHDQGYANLFKMGCKKNAPPERDRNRLKVSQVFQMSDCVCCWLALSCFSSLARHKC